MARAAEIESDPIWLSRNMHAMKPLTPSERRALRAKAHHLDPVVNVGQRGLGLAENDFGLVLGV